MIIEGICFNCRESKKARLLLLVENPVKIPVFEIAYFTCIGQTLAKYNLQL